MMKRVPLFVEVRCKPVSVWRILLAAGNFLTGIYSSSSCQDATFGNGVLQQGRKSLLMATYI